MGDLGSSYDEEEREWVVEKVLYIYSLFTVETGGVDQVPRKLKQHSCPSKSSYCPLTPNS